MTHEWLLTFTGLVIGFLIGIAVGWLQSASRQVDRILREETSFRHPVGSRPTHCDAEIFEHVSPTPGAHAAHEEHRPPRCGKPVGDGACSLGQHHPDWVRCWTSTGSPRTLAEVMGYRGTPERIETLGEVLRRQSVVVENVDRPPLIGSNERVVCGKPATTNLGEVRCLQSPGHRGEC